MAEDRTRANSEGSSKPSDLVTVGEIAGVFGIKGWVKVKSFTDPEMNILDYAPWWLKTRHGVKKVEVDQSQRRPQGLVVHIKGVDDRDDAALLTKVKIAVERSQLPSLEEGDYYWHQLIGLDVISRFEGNDQPLGSVVKMLETGANDVLVVAGGSANASNSDERERLIPYLPGSVVLSVDLEGNTIVVDWDPDF